jgi:uncharacterized protein
MFPLIITLVYILPNIYVVLRLGKLFFRKEYRIYYALIYVFIAIFFPLINLFSHGDAGIFSQTAIYLLPYYLYLFLSVLLFDIFMLVNRLVRIVPLDRMKSPRFKTSVLTVVLIFPVLVVIGGAINFNTIRTSGYQIDVPRKSAKIDHLRIAFVADFHLNAMTNVDFVERFAKNIALIQPDLMVFGGDIIEGNREDANRVRFEKILREIHPGYGVFAVYGNHEYYGGGNKSHFFEKAGMTVLCDSIVVIDGSFNLVGRNDSQFRGRKTIGEMMNSVNDSLPVILIDHRPTEIDEVSKTNVDIQLSGHTHDGQLFPINLILKSMYRLVWGYEKIGHTNFFVTSGIRLWGPPVRTVGKSEIMVIDVNFK